MRSHPHGSPFLTLLTFFNAECTVHCTQTSELCSQQIHAVDLIHGSFQSQICCYVGVNVCEPVTLGTSSILDFQIQQLLLFSNMLTCYSVTSTSQMVFSEL